MSLANIQQALLTQFLVSFAEWDTQKRIAWENTDFTAPATGLWLAVHFMPVDERPATLGAGGSERADGLLQVTLAAPLLKGELDTRTVIETLRSCFKPGRYVFDDQVVTVSSRVRGGGFKSDNYWKIPFTVRWRSHLTRT